MPELCPELQCMLDHLDDCRCFMPEEYVNRKCQKLFQYLSTHKLKAAIVSVSGGIDSAVVLSILVETKKRYSNIYDFKIIGLAQPIDSTPEIQARAYEVAALKGIELIEINQSEEHHSIIAKIEKQTGELAHFSKSMFKSYQRTPTAYLLASHYGGAVIGTGNLDEDGYLYYFCKFGDGAVDIGLIWDLHKIDVYAVGKYLGVPESILVAPPSADLMPGQTDENEMGVSYDMVRLIYSLNYSTIQMTPKERLKWLESLSDEALVQYMGAKRIIDEIHTKGHHKADLNPILL